MRSASRTQNPESNMTAFLVSNIPSVVLEGVMQSCRALQQIFPWVFLAGDLCLLPAQYGTLFQILHMLLNDTHFPVDEVTLVRTFNLDRSI